MIKVDLNQLSWELKETDKKFAGALRKNIRAAVTAAGADLVSAIKSEASWSKNIPGAVGMKVKFNTKSSAVTVSVNRTKAPEAKPLELGSRNNPGYIRHPVFGRRDLWVSQRTRPFMAPAIRAQGPGIDLAMQTAIDQTVEESGFRG